MRINERGGLRCIGSGLDFGSKFGSGFGTFYAFTFGSVQVKLTGYGSKCIYITRPFDNNKKVDHGGYPVRGRAKVEDEPHLYTNSLVSQGMEELDHNWITVGSQLVTQGRVVPV